MNFDYDIIISGGGIPGVTLACLLAGSGMSVAVIDPSPPGVGQPAPIGTRTSALMHGSLNILQAAGLVPGDIANAGLLKTLRFCAIPRDKGQKDAVHDFNAGDLGQDQFGLNLPNAPLRVELWDRARSLTGLDLIAPARLYDFETYSRDARGVRIRLDDGTTLHAQALIGADGRNSPVRALSGIDIWQHNPHQCALTCILDHTLPHKDISTEFHYPGGPFTLVPLSGDRSSLVWVEQTKDAEEITRYSKQDVERMIRDKSAGRLGDITLASPLECWPLKIQQARSLYKKRCALVAEAAHVLHPIGAQGLNLSLRDSAILAETLVDAARLGQDPGEPHILAKYAAKRGPDMISRTAATSALNLLVSTNYPMQRHVRRAGLDFIQSLPFLRDNLMRLGLQPWQNASRIMRGEAL